MGGGSCSRGRGFESQYRILDEHISRYIVVKNVKTENKRTEAG